MGVGCAWMVVCVCVRECVSNDIETKFKSMIKLKTCDHKEILKIQKNWVYDIIRNM